MTRPTNHAQEIADARWLLDHADARPWDEHSSYMEAENAATLARDSIISLAPDDPPRPHWLYRIWLIGVAACAVALLAMGVMR